MTIDNTNQINAGLRTGKAKLVKIVCRVFTALLFRFVKVEN